MLPENTIISTPEDDMTIIEIVRGFPRNKDTSVTSYNTKKKKLCDGLIPSTRKSSVTDLIFIETDYDEVKLILTQDHKVYDEETREFIRAAVVPPGMLLKHIDDIEVKVVKVHKICNNVPQDVYTLTVEETQCYFANGILVHNGE